MSFNESSTDENSIMMETSLWDDVPSIVSDMTPPRHESTPTISRRSRCIKKKPKKVTNRKPLKPVNLWDKALKKNKDLAKFIEFHNEQMEKICNFELSIRSEPDITKDYSFQ